MRGFFEDKGGLLGSVDAVKHMAATLSLVVEMRLMSAQINPKRQGFLLAEFSSEEIERIIWFASEITERSQYLSAVIDDLYAEVCSQTSDTSDKSQEVRNAA